MSETKFTPGPWGFSVDNTPFIDERSKCYIHQQEGAPYTENYSDVATTCDGELIDIQIANAHLIAAAPEMYETIDKLSTELLHMIRAENARLLQSVNSTDTDSPDYLDEESVYLARKLLAKARGEHE